MVRLSAVVPATDLAPTLGLATAAIVHSQDPPDELLVVDEPTHLSAAEARNVGARRAEGDVVVFVDADVEVHPDAFARVRAAFDADPDLTAVFGSYDEAPSAPGTVSAFRNLLHHHVHQAGDGPAETFWAGLGAVRRRAFLAAGGFDAHRFPHPSIEDIELGSRLAADGARIRLDPTIQGKHLKTWTLDRMLFTDFARRGVPWVGLQLRTGRISSALNCSWRHRLSAAACVAGGVCAVGRRPLGTAVAGLSLLALNHSFYGLLARRRGRAEAVAGVGLHVLHHLAAAAALPAGLMVHAHERASGGFGGRPDPLASVEGGPAPTKRIPTDVGDRRVASTTRALPVLAPAAAQPRAPRQPAAALA